MEANNITYDEAYWYVAGMVKGFRGTRQCQAGFKIVRIRDMCAGCLTARRIPIKEERLRRGIKKGNSYPTVNLDIRAKAEKHGIALCKIAHAAKISEGTLSKWMQKELDELRRQRVEDALDALIKQKNRKEKKT